MVEMILKVEGMSCGMCESHVNDAIRNACPVKKVKSSHVKNQTTIVLEDASFQETIVNAVKALGYGAECVSVKPYERRGLLGLFKKRGE